MLTIPFALAAESATDYQPLRDLHSTYRDEIALDPRKVDDDMIAAIIAAAANVGDTRTGRAFAAIATARSGDISGKVPNLTAFPVMLNEYLRANFIDGWVYRRNGAGHLTPALVTSIAFMPASQSDTRDSVSVTLTQQGSTGGRDSKALRLLSEQVTFYGADVSRRQISRILEAKGLLVETPALRAEYDASAAEYDKILARGFAHQYRYSGTPLKGDGWRTPTARTTKVMHDLHPAEIAALHTEVPTPVVRPEKGDMPTGKAARGMLDGGGYGAVPANFMLDVFDLASHENIWVDARDLVRYQYDASLREKIVLPADQRNLLDILTTNLSDFTSDVVEGKTIGNVILCKGSPGVGKTLTAEVYAELIERPLYSIHSGTLGVDAESVRKRLESVFKRAKRWNAVLLLDEADVFVLERGNDLQQNAIVAEFQRTLEYFDGLMFMTTNRGENIDDAILSRAAAIIDYRLPDSAGIREVWKVQARNQSTTLPDDLLDALVDGFARISPRDVKMLLRLALRVSAGNNTPLDVSTFQRCAMFRGLHFAPGSRTA